MTFPELMQLFNRLDAAISHHQRAHESGRYFTDTPDEALWHARAKILADAANRDTRAQPCNGGS